MAAATQGVDNYDNNPWKGSPEVLQLMGTCKILRYTSFPCSTQPYLSTRALTRYLPELRLTSRSPLRRPDRQSPFHNSAHPHPSSSSDRSYRVFGQGIFGHHQLDKQINPRQWRARAAQWAVQGRVRYGKHIRTCPHDSTTIRRYTKLRWNP